ncbi:malonate--CoA ligase [Denitrobaculum tricleocarpae]|uniref:Malonyl-CoA synthase n=1 Tax=Denitrobaculum tricleocarpae TaxID=2591009 RepID=A0A545TTK5_9PROT|nr:malonyl-CoA synthase [Denitrobaculum tricleocarpae]TQV80549.1 malonyl-CoA synthase [Denitrobaculum tricleocarpae]
MNENLYNLLSAHFPKDLSQRFIETADAATYSYADLIEHSGRFGRLLSNLGVKKGDRVAVQVEKSPEAIFLYLGCLRIGAIYLPLNTAYKETEVAYFLGDAEPTVVVCRPASEAAMGKIAESAGVSGVLTLGQDRDGTLVERSLDLDPEIGCVEASHDDIAAILYTSGTTGRSKGAMLSHRNLGSNTETLHKLWGFQPDDVLLHALPIFHTHGLFVATNCVLLNGSSMLFLNKFDADKMIELLPRASVMMGVPTFYTRLLADARFTRDVCANMRLFISGSAPLLEETFQQFQARTGHSILERYGMTETNMNTSNPLEGERRAGTVGFPLPDVEVRIADDDGNILATNEPGVLEVKGPNVFQGYWRMPEKTASEFRPDGFFITGDVAKIDERGYIHIVGRAKDLIITGGFNVYPKEIELCVDAVEGVGESAVIGLPHPDFGEAVVAVVTRSGAANLDGQSIIDSVKDDLANFKVPKKVVFLEELPRNSMGKVQKNVLRETYKDSFTTR